MDTGSAETLLGELRGPDYQVVLIVDNDDGRMFPLTEDVPKCLLPIANRTLLSYQLDLLRKYRAAGVYPAPLYFCPASHIGITTLPQRYSWLLPRIMSPPCPSSSRRITEKTST